MKHYFLYILYYYNNFNIQFHSFSNSFFQNNIKIPKIKHNFVCDIHF